MQIALALTSWPPDILAGLCWLCTCWVPAACEGLPCHTTSRGLHATRSAMSYCLSQGTWATLSLESRFKSSFRGWIEGGRWHDLVTQCFEEHEELKPCTADVVLGLKTLSCSNLL